jgi:DnaK suppressor protein
MGGAAVFQIPERTVARQSGSRKVGNGAADRIRPARSTGPASTTTGLSRAEQAAARTVLAAERERTQARVEALQRDFDDIVSSSASGSADYEHDPEGSSTAFDRQHVAALLSQARDHLAEISRAAERVADGSYGTCERCGLPIGAERLAARPAAATCIRCAAAHDRGTSGAISAPRLK